MMDSISASRRSISAFSLVISKTSSAYSRPTKSIGISGVIPRPRSRSLPVHGSYILLLELSVHDWLGSVRSLKNGFSSIVSLLQHFDIHLRKCSLVYQLFKLIELL